MKLIRLLAAAGVAALVLLAGPGAGPAMAANDVTINSPSDTPQEAYPALAGTVTQSGSQGTVTKVDLKLTSVDGWDTENALATYSGGTPAAPFSGGGSGVSFSWKPTPKYNGRYTFTVNGSGSYNAGLGGTRNESGGASRSFNVEIAPAKPTGVAAGLPEGSTKATVSWVSNPEPDLLGYLVKRSYQGGSPKDVGDVAPASKPKFIDDLTGAPQGAYKYSIVAVRRARTCKTESSDEACQKKLYSVISAQSGAVTVRATPATTTTSTTIKKPSTGGGGTGGGGTGGGSTGGGSTGGGSTGGGTKTPTGKAAPKNNTNFTPGGVDLSQFGNLLGGNGKTTRTPQKEDEGTYDAEIKGYDSSENAVDSNNDDSSLITIGGASLPKPSDDWVRFIGAGSLATALLVHVLWFKQQVDSIPLEALTD